MKESGNLLCKTNLTKHEMQEAVMNIAEPVYTTIPTKSVVNIIYSTYKRSNHDKFASITTQLISEECY